MRISGFFAVEPGFPKSATLLLAASELASLALRRFQEPGNVTARFLIEKGLPSFELRTEGNTLVVAGPTEVEILYGVYDFAEKFLGFCFFEPGRDLLSQEGAVELPDGVIVPARRVPFKKRGLIQEYPFDRDSVFLADWMAKNKLNFLNVWMKYYDELSEEGKRAFLVRGIEIQSGHHNFDYWIPAKKYHKDHPEFFAEINGVRIKPEEDENELLLSKQLCTTNPGLRREIVNNMVRYAAENPELHSVALNPNDGFGWCECKECSKFYDKNHHGELYSLSQHVYIADRIYHDMVRDTAAQLAEKRPDLKLYFGAYINYCRPSEGFKLPPNLGVWMAPYWRCVNHNIDDPACPVNSHYADDIRAWCRAKAGGEVIIYEYYMGVNFYLSLPLIFHRTIFEECKFYESIGVDGVMTQFHPPHWSVYGMNYVAMARALRGENAGEAIPALMKSLFGTDAPEAEAFYKAMRKLTDSTGPCHIPYPYSLFSRTKLEQYCGILKMAKELAAKAPHDAFRKELVIWAEYLYRFKALFDAYHDGAAGIPEIDAFLAWIHSHRDTKVFVQSKFDPYFEAWRTAIRQRKPWLHFNIDWEDAYIRKHEKLLNGLEVGE